MVLYDCINNQPTCVGQTFKKYGCHKVKILRTLLLNIVITYTIIFKQNLWILNNSDYAILISEERETKYMADET